MKLFFTTLLSVTILSSLFGQETRKITIENEDPRTKEVFYVLKDKPDIKHGEYKRVFTGSVSLKEQGRYDNNVKVGIWEYYGIKGGLEQKIDFTNNTVVFSKPFDALTKSMILEGEILKENNSGEVPVFLGGQSKLLYYLVKYIRYPANARRTGTQGSVFISATVTSDGRLIDEKVEKGLGFGLDEEALRVIQLLPDEWLPLRIKGEAVNTRITLEVKFKLA